MTTAVVGNEKRRGLPYFHFKFRINEFATNVQKRHYIIANEAAAPL